MPARGATVGVRELRQNLSVYLDRVKKGAALIVTEHGQEVAELRPRRSAGDPLASLLESGRVRRPGPGASARPRPLDIDLPQPLSALLDDLREDTV